ncbi:MAG: MBL fold metallo-hydrolase [Nitrospirota bacterium]|nr:MBL fold metallo-hydrolase [Nitrospirota bacterium]
MIIKQIPVGTIANFNYLIGDPDSGTAALVDPAWEPERLLAEARELGLSVTHILLTHCHSDHVQANGAIKEATGAEIYVHRAEFPYLKHFLPPAGDVAMEDGGQVQVGGLTVRWLHTPGHSPGSSCLYVGDALIAGDTLFVNSIGRTDFPGSDPEEMWESICKLKALPDHVTVYPGHHYGPTPTTTIGDQKRANPYWQPDTLEAFLALAQPENDEM